MLLYKAVNQRSKVPRTNGWVGLSFDHEMGTKIIPRILLLWVAGDTL